MLYEKRRGGDRQPLLSVFTPTYNRKHLLDCACQSVLRQNLDCLEWIIIDDGSDDGTFEWLAHWAECHDINIVIKRKRNGGMHTAHNEARKHVRGAFVYCLDSDDLLPDGLVETVQRLLPLLKGGGLGIVGLNESADGGIIGSPFESQLSGTIGPVMHLYDRGLLSGDKKFILRGEVFRSCPDYPVFDGERLVPIAWLYRQLELNGEFLRVNDVLGVVDYQPGGSSATVRRQYLQSPRGFAEERHVVMRHSRSLLVKLRTLILWSIHINTDRRATRPSSVALTVIVNALQPLAWMVVRILRSRYK